MSVPRFFGFGSLVNVKTHTYPNPQPFEVKGWQRVWRKTTLRDIAFLSAEPAPDTRLLGLTAEVPNSDWNALDDRETGYDRVQIHADVSLYSVPKSNFSTDPKGVVLLSYLDVVIQGYLTEFGTAGVQHFFATTKGWHHHFQNDRTKPLYPRAQNVSRDIRDMVDQHLAAQMKK